MAPCCAAALPALVFIALILKEPDLGTALVCAASDGADAVSGGRAGEVLRYRRGLRLRRCCITCCSVWPGGARACWRF